MASLSRDDVTYLRLLTSPLAIDRFLGGFGESSIWINRLMYKVGEGREREEREKQREMRERERVSQIEKDEQSM